MKSEIRNPKSERSPNFEIRIRGSAFGFLSDFGLRISDFGRAFTLIEVLLSVSIFAIVLIAMNTVFYSAMRLRATTSRVVDEAAPLNQALTLLRRDLQGAVPPGSSSVTLAGDFKSGAISSSMGVGQYNGIEFYTSTGRLTADAPWADIQKVSYQLKDSLNRNGSRGKDLVRVATRNLLATMNQDANERWLMGGIESVQFECFNGADWRDSWDTSLGDTNLPLAVRVNIVLAKENGGSVQRGQPLEMVVPLVSQTRTNL